MELIIKDKIEINGEYLLGLSKQVDLLSKLGLLERRGSLTQEFSVRLQNGFKELGQLLAIYGEDVVMADVAVIRCKADLQFFVWEKVNALLSSVAGELSETMGYLLSQMRQKMTSLERLVHRERVSRAEVLDAQKDKIIANLRRDLGVKREYMLDLQQRVREVEQQNSKLYSKMITNAKQKVDFFSRSPTKGHHDKFRSTQTDKSMSPKSKKAKPIMTRSYQDQVNIILQQKWKFQSINQRKTSLSDYLRTYFTMKFGKPLAEQNQSVFRDAVGYLARTQEKHIFVLFQAVLDQECDQCFIQQERLFLDRVVKCLKRYLNQKYGKPLHELDRMFERGLEERNDFELSEGDVSMLLENVYRSGEVRTLQMILSQLAGSRNSGFDSYSAQNGQSQGKLSCRRFLNELLDYELKKHLMRVDDIVRQIGRLDRGQFLTGEQVQRVALRVIHERQRCELFLQNCHEDRKWTVSQVIEMLQKARHVRVRRQ